MREVLEEIVDNQRINEAQCEEPGTDVQRKAELKRFIDEKDSPPILLHMLGIVPLLPWNSQALDGPSPDQM
jgi:hypothetical protein